MEAGKDIGTLNEKLRGLAVVYGMSELLDTFYLDERMMDLLRKDAELYADKVAKGWNEKWNEEHKKGLYFASALFLSAAYAFLLYASSGGFREKKGAGPYSHLDDPENVAPGKDFIAAQKKAIIEENMKNGGAVNSDLSGQELVQPGKSQKGVTPPDIEWQIDHIKPKSKGGSNSYSNAQVLSRAENRAKWNR